MSDKPVRLGGGREFDAVRSLLGRWGALAQGIGDDAAVLALPAGHRLVVSTDVAVEHVHFRGDWLSPREIAYRATAAALSDLAAMAARPVGILTAMTVPREWRQHLDELGEGIADAAALAVAPIVGGDLSDGAHLSLCVTVLGAVRNALRRDGARAGDNVYVTGRFGGARKALDALLSGEIPEPTARHRFATPVPRLVEAQWLARRGASSAIDISDGLASDLGHLATASAVTMRIDLDRLPTDGSPPRYAYASGEEYELAVTSPAALDVRDFAECFGIPLTQIGVVEDGHDGSVVVSEGGEVVELPRGYDHFSR
jgi:thiamine-monophosphate kinase